MAKIIAVHSFRGGTGKSNTTANLSGLLAAQGMRVGIVDTDIVSPGIHVLFGMNSDDIQLSLNDYLWGKCEIEEAAQDVTARLKVPLKGKIYLIPSSMQTADIAKVLREGYDVGLLNDGYMRLIDCLNLDVLMIDTHPGLNEETLLSIAIADEVIIVLRPDSQDYQGTAVTVEVARKLDVPHMVLVVNKSPVVLDPQEVKNRVATTFQCEVAAVLPHSDEMMLLGSDEIFALRYPYHPLTNILQQVAMQLVQE